MCTDPEIPSVSVCTPVHGWPCGAPRAAPPDAGPDIRRGMPGPAAARWHPARLAAGLAWRGLHPRDVVGVHVPDAVCHALATHAIRAAGGVPSPVAAGLTVPEMAGQLADCGARMLLTAPPLAAAALAAADRSWVRQVISFGEAPGATPFEALLKSGSLRAASGRRGDPALLPYVPLPDGALSPAA